MKIVVVSDTHGQHGKIELPPGDVLIHAGDSTLAGKVDEVVAFGAWLDKAADIYQRVIFIAGNHEFLAEESPYLFNSMLTRNIKIIYLENNLYEYEGVKFYGSPVTPYYHGWAFNKQRGPEIKRYWDMIPDGPDRPDVLITHGPPYGILDENWEGEPVGCKDLLAAVQRIKPKIHVFGHLHNGYGFKKEGETLFVNASYLDDGMRAAHLPFVLDLETDL